MFDHSILIGIIIFLVIVIVTFVGIVFWPRPKCFFDYKKYYPFLSSIEKKAQYDAIVEQCAAVVTAAEDSICDSKNLRLYKLYSAENQNVDGDEKKRFDLSNVPALYEILQPHINEVNGVYICDLDKFASTQRMYVHKELANTSLRVVMLISPLYDCKVWCDGETKFMRPNAPICFDHSRENIISNTSYYEKTSFLILDMVRPKCMPHGISNNTNKKCPVC